MRTKSKYEDEYLEADKYVILNNNDSDLRPIVLSLPKPPPLHLIDGYGLPPDEQRFKRVSIPYRLESLEAEALQEVRREVEKTKKTGAAVSLIKIQKKFWDLLMSRQKTLKKEIDFIRRVWWWRLNGYWCFIHGKPTYITGRHFFYLNFFYMDTDSGFADYRDCDRREYIFMEYCWTTTETFARIDKEGYAIREEDGQYKMVDLGRRVCFGSGQSKNRRRGNTSKAISDGIEIITRTMGTDGFGIQSYTEENAKAHFKGKVMPAWEKLPLWMKPYSTSGRVSDTLKLDVSNNDFGLKGLNTQVTYATTSSPKAFDGKKMKCLLVDESGKDMNGGSVAKRHEVNKHTLAQGDGMVINGFTYNPSTVDQLAAGAFDYHYLMESSNFYKRIPVKGQTVSGLFRVFIPAQDGLEGHIDSYGYSVTGEVKDYQKEEGFKETAEEYLQGERDLLLEDGSPEAMQKYREHKKLFPMKYSDSWLGEAGNIGFNMEAIDLRLSELRRTNTTVRGNFEWVDGIFGGKVTFIHDEEKGRFNVSKMPSDEVCNKKVKVIGFNPIEQKNTEMWRPMYPDMFTMGVDPFDFAGKNASRTGASIGKVDKLSDGGIAVLWNYDNTLDKGSVKSEWESYRFVLTYRHRAANTDFFNEDVLKAAIYFGAMVYPETNLSVTYEYFVRMGFGGYLLYDTDKYTGMLKPKPGMDSLERSKQDLFSALRDYIDFRCHKEQHVDFLRECKEIRGIEMMRHYDLLAACGLALMGSKSTYSQRIKGIQDNDYDLDQFNIW